MKNPGLVYADQIVVQSENMKNVYEELLSEMIGKEKWGEKLRFEIDGLLDFEEKIIGIGSALRDEINHRDPDLPEGWNGKKVLLYCLSASALFEYGETELNKVRQVLKCIREQYSETIAVMIHADRYTRQVLRKHNSVAWSAYQRFVTECNDLHILFDDEWDEDKVGAFSDAVIGDGAYIMTKCREAGKPALFHNPTELWKEPDGYVYKKWTENTFVASENVWSVANFLQEILVWKVAENEETSYGRHIWSEIRQ